MASDDPQFEEKAADVIGLYLVTDSSQHAAIFCVDEKTAIQARDRLERFRFMRPWTVKTGQVHGKTVKRYTSAEFIDFWRTSCEARWAKKIHIVLDHLSAYKTRWRNSLRPIPRLDSTSCPHLHRG